MRGGRWRQTKLIYAFSGLKMRIEVKNKANLGGRDLRSGPFDCAQDGCADFRLPGRNGSAPCKQICKAKPISAGRKMTLKPLWEGGYKETGQLAWGRGKANLGGRRSPDLRFQISDLKFAARASRAALGSRLGPKMTKSAKKMHLRGAKLGQIGLTRVRRLLECRVSETEHRRECAYEEFHGQE